LLGGKKNTKFLAGAGFLHGKASLTAAILCDMARGTLFFFLVTFCLKGGGYVLSALNTICRNASTTNSECGRNVLLVQVLKNTVNVKSHCFLPCHILTKFSCTSTGYFLKDW